MSEMGHVLPQQQKKQSSSSASSSASGLPPADLLLLALAISWSAPRLLQAVVNVANYAVGGLPPLLHTLLSWLSPSGLLGLIPIACVAMLVALDDRTGTAFRIAAAAGLATAFVWSFVAHLLPDGLRPHSQLGSFLLFGLVPTAARLIFAHWIAALLISAKRQPAITFVA